MAVENRLPEWGPQQSYDSITQKLFTLDADTIVFPGHDYNNATSTMAADQRIIQDYKKIYEQFIEIMNI